MQAVRHGAFSINPYPVPPGATKVRRWWISYGGQPVGPPLGFSSTTRAKQWIDNEGGGR